MTEQLNLASNLPAAQILYPRTELSTGTNDEVLALVVKVAAFWKQSGEEGTIQYMFRETNFPRDFAKEKHPRFTVSSEEVFSRLAEILSQRIDVNAAVNTEGWQEVAPFEGDVYGATMLSLFSPEGKLLVAVSTGDQKVYEFMHDDSGQLKWVITSELKVPYSEIVSFKNVPAKYGFTNYEVAELVEVEEYSYGENGMIEQRKFNPQGLATDWQFYKEI